MEIFKYFYNIFFFPSCMAGHVQAYC